MIFITIDEKVDNNTLAQIAECFLAHAPDEERWLKESGLISEDARLEVSSNYSTLEYDGGFKRKNG